MEGRFDTIFYLPPLRANVESIKLRSHRKLKSIVKFSSETWDGKSIFGNDFPYIEISGIDTTTGAIKEVSIIPVKQAPSRAKKIIRSNDILVSTTRPTRGAITLIDNKYDMHIASTGFAVIRYVNEHKVNTRFLYHMLRSSICLKQMLQRSSGGNYPAITEDELGNIVIPIPDSTIQDSVVKIMEVAVKQLQEKQETASRLLSQESEYVAHQLGIHFAQEKTYKNTFFVKYNKTINRLDPLYYSKDLFAFLEGITHRVLPIFKVMRYMKTGFAAGRENQDMSGDGVIQIRPTNIDDDRNLIFDKNVYIDRKELSSRHGDILCRGEVLFNNTNSQELVGKTTYFDLEGDYFCSNHITRIGVDDSIIEPEYLCLILNLYQRNKIFYHLCTNWNNQSGVNVGLLRKIDIPVPDLDIQRGIISEVNRRKQLAAQLRQEAIQGLEAAKAEVERMILGE